MIFVDLGMGIAGSLGICMVFGRHLGGVFVS
jgi:hypothetical protein